MKKSLVNKLSNYQCEFQRDFRAQNLLLIIAFDRLSHELIMAKLNAFGFSLSALQLMQSYLTERKQSTKINQAYGSWKEMLFDVRPKIYTYICVNHLFLLIKNIGFAGYADVNTIYNAGSNTHEVYFSSRNYLNIFLSDLLIIRSKVIFTNVI